MKNTPQFQEALNRFVARLNEMVENYRVENKFTFAKAFGVTIDGGNKYIRISSTETDDQDKVKIKGVHCFIDTTNGNILKANTYKAACLKNPRGNIFKENCLEGVTVHGVVYLR
jgi:hypothetical protein